MEKSIEEINPKLPAYIIEVTVYDCVRYIKLPQDETLENLGFMILQAFHLETYYPLNGNQIFTLNVNNVDPTQYELGYESLCVSLNELGLKAGMTLLYRIAPEIEFKCLIRKLVQNTRFKYKIMYSKGNDKVLYDILADFEKRTKFTRRKGPVYD